MPFATARRSPLSDRIAPGAPLKVRWYQLRPGPAGLRFPGFPGDGELVERSEAGGVDGLVLQGRNSCRVVEDQVGDGVEECGRAPPFGVARQRDALCGAVEVRDDEWTGRRAGIVELSFVEHVGLAVMLLGSSMVLPENIPRHSA